MPNNNYLKGRNAEYATIKTLEKQHYFAMRSAGSHKIDVIAFLQKDKLEYPLIKAISVKSGKYISKKDIKELKDIKLPNIVEKQIWHYRPHKKVKIIDVENT